MKVAVWRGMRASQFGQCKAPHSSRLDKDNVTSAGPSKEQVRRCLELCKEHQLAKACAALMSPPPLKVSGTVYKELKTLLARRVIHCDKGITPSRHHWLIVPKEHLRTWWSFGPEHQALVERMKEVLREGDAVMWSVAQDLAS